MGEKTFNSSSFGHLVIPRIKEDLLRLTIGFSRKSIPEQDFELKINGKDRGYELDLENNNQIFLFDWQTSSKIATTTPPAIKSGLAVTGIKRTDPFAMLMAGVVNDSLVLFTEKTAVKAEVASVPVTKLPDSSAAIDTIKKDSSVGDLAINEKKNKSVSNKIKDSVGTVQKPADPAPEPFRRAVTPTVEKETIVGDTLAGISLDNKESASISGREGKQDTVAKEAVTVLPAVSLIEESSSPDEKRMVFQVNETKEKIDVIIKKDSEPVIEETKPVIAEPEKGNPVDSTGEKSGVVLLNSDCQRFANDSDVDRLRIQMLKEANDDDRVFAARKVFRTKCFTVKQVTALTELFKDDAARYMFFDAAYPFVYDSGNFKSLISLLKDEYYINRFKALVRM
jgi:hypothetical protein